MPSDMEIFPENHYVIVVHGTWSSPNGLQTKWYEPGGSFSSLLQEMLRHSALRNSIARKVSGRPIVFAWSGKNTHSARLEAAKKLCDLLLHVRANDPAAQIHLVSHSHGGNVTLKALEYYFQALYDELWT